MSARRHLRRAGAFAALLAATLAHGADDALTGDMVQRLRRAYPSLEVRVRSADLLEMFEGGKSVLQLDLGNLRAICAARPSDCEAQKDRRVQFVATARSDRRPPFALGDVRAVLRPADYLANVRQQFERMGKPNTPDEAAKLESSMPVSAPFGAGFVRMWVQDSPTGMSPLSRARVEEQKLTTADLDRASAENMRNEAVPPLRQSPQHPALWFSIGNDYVSSVMVDEALWKRVAGALAGREVAVCFPEREALLAYFPHLDPKGDIDPVQLCRNAASRGAVPFSNQSIRRINDNWNLR